MIVSVKPVGALSFMYEAKSATSSKGPVNVSALVVTVRSLPVYVLHTSSMYGAR